MGRTGALRAIMRVGALHLCEIAAEIGCKSVQLEGIVHAQARGALAIAVRVPYNPCPWCEGPGIAYQEELWHTTLARFDSKWASSQSSV